MSGSNQKMKCSTQRQIRGLNAYQAGLAAEDEVTRLYVGRGCRLLERRWRGKGGEIDLVFDDRESIIFVEVKKARSVQDALRRLQPRQLGRFHALGEEYLGKLSGGLATPARWDLAALGQLGDVEIVENITLA